MLGREEERYVGALRDCSELLHQVVGDGHAVLKALLPRGHLGVARDEHGLIRVGPLRVVQHVDHLVEIPLELPLRPEGPRIDGHEEVADVSAPPRMCTSTASP